MRRDFGIGDAARAAAGRHVVVGDAERESRLGDRAPRAFIWLKAWNEPSCT